MIVVGFNVPPAGSGCLGREFPHVHWVGRVGNFDKRRTIVQTENGEFSLGGEQR